VRIRVLTLDYELKPFKKVHNLIFVSDPSGSRVAQWLDVDNKNGKLKNCTAKLDFVLHVLKAIRLR